MFTPTLGNSLTHMESEKDCIRKLVKTKLLAMPNAEKEKASAEIWRQIEQLPQFASSANILAYWSMPIEVGTHEYLERLKDRKNILLPVIRGQGLELVKFTGKANLHKHHRYPIWEPVGNAFDDFDAVTLALIPGMAFGQNLARLGKGGGFYDRLLPQLPNALKVGVAFSCQLLESVPTNAHDIAMDRIITAGMK